MGIVGGFGCFVKGFLDVSGRMSTIERANARILAMVSEFFLVISTYFSRVGQFLGAGIHSRKKRV